MYLKVLYNESVKNLKDRGFRTPELDVRILLEFVGKYSLEDLIFNPDIHIDSNTESKFKSLLDRRMKSEPIAKIIGKKSFWKSEFLVNSNTLDPRPDSEVIIQEVLELCQDKEKNLSILDLGTGSGCLIISLLLEFGNARGTAIDISREALAISKKNAEILGVLKRVNFINKDWSDEILDRFDIIVSNPPYIPTNDIKNLDIGVKNFDPIIALDGGKDGLDPYRYLALKLKELLKPEAFAILEFGYNQVDEVQKIFEINNYEIINILFDLSGHARAITVRNKNV